MFEHKHEPLLPAGKFYRRLAWFSVIGLAIIVVCLGIGILGYHAFEGQSWLDSLLNAAMILGGMGPVDILHKSAGKVFAACYALFSGIVFIAAVGVLLAPIVHRLMHRFHLDMEEADEPAVKL